METLEDNSKLTTKSPGNVSMQNNLAPGQSSDIRFIRLASSTLILMLRELHTKSNQNGKFEICNYLISIFWHCSLEGFVIVWDSLLRPIDIVHDYSRTGLLHFSLLLWDCFFLNRSYDSLRKRSFETYWTFGQHYYPDGNLTGCWSWILQWKVKPFLNFFSYLTIITHFIYVLIAHCT